MGPFEVLASTEEGDKVYVTIAVPAEQARRMGLVASALEGLSVPDSPASLCEGRPTRPEGAL